MAYWIANCAPCQIVCQFDPAAFYDVLTTRAHKTRDVTAAFLTAIEEDRHITPEKKSIVAEEVRALRT